MGDSDIRSWSGERPRIAVTGIGILCSVANSTEEFAAALRDGRSGIGRVELAELFWCPCHLGAEIRNACAPSAFPRRSLRLTRSQVIAIRAATEALADGGLDAERRRGLRIGTSFGSCQDTVTEFQELAGGRGPEIWEVVRSSADAVAQAFDLTGPRIVASNACAAGGSAIALARDCLLSGWADVMLAGGSDQLAFFTYAGFSVLQSLDTRPCSPYGRSSGLTLGEGAGVLVLETFEHARRRGATIVAELAGCGASADGYHPTAPDPTGRGAALALRRALAHAGIDPSEVDYVNGHGTGTPSNDEMERLAFKSVFGERARTLPISSTKSMIGHTLGASGAIEAAACIIAIRDGILPPTINMPEDAPSDFDFVPNRSRQATVRVAVSNNYAFGGSNSSLVFREPTMPRTAATWSANGARPVITGFGVVGGLGEGLDAWKAALLEGRSAVRPLVLREAAADIACLGAEVGELNPKRYASRNDWRKMNPLARISVASTRLAVADAGLGSNRSACENAALLYATGAGALRETMEFARSAHAGEEAASPNMFPHTAGNAAAGHVCTVLGIHGPMLSMSQETSSLIALQYAGDLIREGIVQVAIVLSADDFCAAWIRVFGTTRTSLQATRQFRPFDARAEGTAFGTAAVSIVLESDRHARERNARPYAELLGAGVVGSPYEEDDPAASRVWAEAMRLAIDRSAIDPARVGYCAAAGSGIPALDDVELAAIADVFEARDLWVSAPKASTGETLGAATAVNVLAAALALRDDVLVPTANLETPRPPHRLQHVMGRARVQRTEYCIANAATPGGMYGSVVLGAAR